MTRVCTKCDTAHPVSFFNKDRTRADGLYPQCKTCSRAACKRVFRKYHDKHLALKQRWKDDNRERHREINREYQAAYPERNRATAAAYRARLKRATPPWVDLEAIAFIRDLCPTGYHVDHIHPLAGYNSCGLNVPWNLQFLPAEEHYKKGRKLIVEECNSNL